jgi:cell division protein FtsZ
MSGIFEIAENNQTNGLGAKIKVVGIGGGGGNAVNTMIKAGLTGVEYIVANTDIQALHANLAPTKIQLGHEITKGLGAGANPEVGRKAALDEYEGISEILEGADMVFITAGMGGGTGTGGAPVIAKLAKELGCLTVGVVTKPFLFEGKRRFRQAGEGIRTLEESVDSLITIPNQRLLYLAGDNLSLVDTFKKADEVLLNAVRGISDLINNTGHINCDFADVSTVMANKGLSLMGTGICSGPDRAVKAATEAISSPLLEDISIDGATGIIINITGSETLSMHETHEAVTLIMEAADDDAEIIFGTVIDKEMEDDVQVTVIATGLGGKERVKVSDVQQDLPKEKAPIQEKVEVRKPIEERYEVKEQIVDEERPAVSNPERELSSLERTIQEASKSYQQEILSTPKPVNHVRAEAPAERPVSNRTKSIAEKLGFINFDEDELDRPSYLRREGQDNQELNS